MKPILSSHCRIRHPEHFVVGAYSIVDDYCYFSTKVQIGVGSHVASQCSVAGGPGRQFTLGDFSSLSSGVRIWCTSDDFVNDLVMLVPPGMPSFKKRLLEGDVLLANYTAVGSNSVVMPSNSIPEGTTVGALSFVPPGFDFKPWSVYAGNPLRFVKARNRDAVLEQVDLVREWLTGKGK